MTVKLRQSAQDNVKENRIKIQIIKCMTGVLYL